MIDFILWTFWILTFVGGFWCGSKYGTAKKMLSSWCDEVETWLKSS